MFYSSGNLNMTRFITLIICCLGSSFAFTQHFDCVSNSLFGLEEDSAIGALWSTQNKSPLMEEYIVNTVVHVLYQDEDENLSDQTIFDLIRETNYIFEGNIDTTQVNPIHRDLIHNTKIRLCLAETSPEGNYTNGITRRQVVERFDLGVIVDERFKYDSLGGTSAWNIENYLNIWIIPFDDAFGSFNYGIPYQNFMPLGDPQSAISGATLDINNFSSFTIISSIQRQAGIIAHECGHVFGLLHTFGSNVDGSSCDTDDSMGDTPKCVVGYGCADYNRNTCIEPVNDLPDNNANIMNYACQAMISPDQSMAMKLNLDKIQSLLHSSCGQTVSTQDLIKEPFFEIFPNPNEGTFKINSSFAKATLIEVFDITGRRVHSSIYSLNNDIDLSHLSKGAYFISLNYDQGRYVEKLMIQ